MCVFFSPLGRFGRRRFIDLKSFQMQDEQKQPMRKYSFKMLFMLYIVVFISSISTIAHHDAFIDKQRPTQTSRRFPGFIPV